MKIGLSGTSCVGKSTIFNILKEKLSKSELTFLNESARELLESGAIRSVGETCSNKDQLYMLEEHYKNTLKHQNFFSDRGILDGFVYATQSYLDGAYDFQQHKEHEELFLQCINDYTDIFYIPLNNCPIPLVHDDVRKDSLEYRQQIDNLFQTIIQKYHLTNVHSINLPKDEEYTPDNVAKLLIDIMRSKYNL